MRAIVFPHARNDAERAAIAWACEMTLLEAAADAMADRLIAWVDFDQMLANLGRIVDFFGLVANESQLQAIGSGPLMTRYSKGLEFEYSPSLRDDLIACHASL